MKIYNQQMKFILLTLIMFGLPSNDGMAQSQEKNYATLILNFSRGIVWPSGNSEGNFVIGVFEYPPLATELILATSNIKINNRKIVVKEFNSIDEVQGCNILFVPAFKAKALTNILTEVGSEPVLIVTNKFDLARRGSGVNFTLVDGKLKYEINSKSIEARGLKISAGIKGMGIEVN
jgi:hypothetical protein